MYIYPAWVPEVFFSREAIECGRLRWFGSAWPKTRKRSWLKPETAHEKSLVPRDLHLYYRNVDLHNKKKNLWIFVGQTPRKVGWESRQSNLRDGRCHYKPQSKITAPVHPFLFFRWLGNVSSCSLLISFKWWILELLLNLDKMDRIFRGSSVPQEI